MRPFLLSIAILMVFAAVAQAAKFTGETAQDRRVVVRTDSDDLPLQFGMRWSAECDDDSNIVHATTFQEPFRESSARRVRDGGPYTTHVRDERGRRYELRVRTRMRAHLENDDEWRGRFRMTMKVYRNDRFITDCGTGRVRWTATR
jgi:hypothetical protein